jgi:hypothetical protein
MTKRKIPRKRDVRVTYTPQQTQRYKSQWSRYQKGLKIATEHAVHKIDEETYRIPSVRAPDGYWEIKTKEDKAVVTGTWTGEKPSDGQISLNWRGEKPSDGQINLNWRGKKPTDGQINLRWEGKKCESKIPIPPPGENYPINVSGCSSGWSIFVAACFKITRNGDFFVNERIPVSEFGDVFRSMYNDSRTDIEILQRNGGTGEQYFLPSGYYMPNVHEGDILSPGGPGQPRYSCLSSGGFVVTSPVSSIEQILDEISSLDYYTYRTYDGPGNNDTFGQAIPELVAITNPPSGSPNDNCDLFDYAPPNSNPPTCKRGKTIGWNCDYAVPPDKFSMLWTITSDNGVITNDRSQSLSIAPCPPPESGLSNIKLVAINSVTGNNNSLDVDWNCEYTISSENFSLNWTITNDNGAITNDQNQSLTVTPCTPPESGLSNIKLVNINSVTSNNNGYEVDWNCEYTISSENFSLNWTITNDNSAIANDQNQSLTVTPCTPPESGLSNIKLVNINSVTSNNNGYEVDWDCEYAIASENFSPNWTITNDNGVITNDQNQSLTVTPCTPPESGLSNIKLKQVSTEVEEGEGYKCTCPDFSKKEGAFTPPAYPSMSQERSWESSDAGAPTWADGKRRCCHIVAVQQVRNEDIPVPEDLPFGEA